LKRKDKIAIVVFIFLISSPFWLSALMPKPKVIATIYTSKNGNLSVQIPSECSELRFGYYTFYELPLSGKISQIDCRANGKTGRIEYKLIPNSEDKKDCHGKMTKLESDQKIITIWEFQDSVLNHKCSLLEKNWKFEMRKTGSPAEEW
jgi:hypothetical protein